MMKKKGFSGVVSTLIFVLLVVALMGVVWVSVNHLVKDRLDMAGSCFGVFDKVAINNQFTCYDASSYDVQFSIALKDIEVEKVLVSIFDSSVKASQTFEITNSLSSSPGLMGYPSANEVALPQQNAAKTYVATGFSGKPEYIEIAPMINGKFCEVSDSTYDIPDCALLVS